MSSPSLDGSSPSMPNSGSPSQNESLLRSWFACKERSRLGLPPQGVVSPAYPCLVRSWRDSESGMPSIAIFAADVAEILSPFPQLWQLLAPARHHFVEAVLAEAAERFAARMAKIVDAQVSSLRRTRIILSSLSFRSSSFGMGRHFFISAMPHRYHRGRSSRSSWEQPEQ